MGIDERSDDLFGRYQALRVYATIARLTKPAFSTGELAKLTGVPTPALSKELGRLVRLELVRSTSRRGDYERIDDQPFWNWCDAQATSWGIR